MKKKPMVVMLICVGVLFGGIIAYKTFGNIMMKRYFASLVPIATVSAMKADYSTWESQQKFYGSLRAVKGVNVTTELAAMVEKIYFVPGSTVKKGDILVQLNASSDIALLRSLEANTKLAKVTLDRDKAQFAIKAVAKATVDADEANYKSLQAQTDQQAAIVAKKTIRAPFDGKLGISSVNPGQYLNVGDTIVPLQDTNFLYADFYVPQQQLVNMKVGQDVRLMLDVFPNRSFTGKISTINPVIDTNTRNVQVEATIDNHNGVLVPGMFATVIVDTGLPQKFITLPQTAITFNSYGDVIFTISEKGKDKTGKPILIATQRFVTTGESRGDQVTILKGIKAGDLVVTSGQLKIKNGAQVVINNTVVPRNDPTPKPVEE
ncbi:MAG: efflux RND transporter periplasmic adaptor subunit [Pseudomonadota bacterium]|nr:efflux RND transporter periplasmic adaptor subunit [Pseudomonadota bacterium]